MSLATKLNANKRECYAHKIASTSITKRQQPLHLVCDIRYEVIGEKIRSKAQVSQRRGHQTRNRVIFFKLSWLRSMGAPEKFSLFFIVSYSKPWTRTQVQKIFGNISNPVQRKTKNTFGVVVCTKERNQCHPFIESISIQTKFEKQTQIWIKSQNNWTRFCFNFCVILSLKTLLLSWANDVCVAGWKIPNIIATEGRSSGKCVARYLLFNEFALK